MPENQNSIITLGNLTIGDGHPCLVMPEGCDNHMGSLERAKEMAAAAKEAGAKIIKWQLHIPEEEMVKADAIAASKEMLAKWGSIWDFVEKFSLSVDDHWQLKEYCDKIGIQYFCTPFSYKAAQILDEMGVYGFKIGSGETEDLPMIESIAALHKPMIISTGMTELAEVDLSVNAVKAARTPYALAYCMSVYSGQPVHLLNYGVISMYKERYRVPIGFSDHTPPDPIKSHDGREVSHEARLWGAVHRGMNFLEKHFTLDRNQDDADSCFSMNPKDLKETIAIVADAESAMGSTRKVYDEEKPVVAWAKRSLVAAIDIPAGAKLERNMFVSKRPATGIRSKDYHQVLGKTAKVSIPKNSILKWDQFEK